MSGLIKGLIDSRYKVELYKYADDNKNIILNENINGFLFETFAIDFAFSNFAHVYAIFGLYSTRDSLVGLLLAIITT